MLKLKSFLALLAFVLLCPLIFDSSPPTVEAISAPTVLLNVPYFGQGYASVDPGQSCGPTSVAMALSYATGQTITIDTVRTQTNHPKGGQTYYHDYIDLWPRYGLRLGETVQRVYSEGDFKAALQAGKPIVAALHMGSNWFTKGADFGRPATDPNQNRGLFDPWIQDKGGPDWGHILVIIGYGTGDNGKDYFVVNDPDYFNQPNYKYNNGTPKGKARQLPVAEVMNAIQGMWRDLTLNRSFALAITPLNKPSAKPAPATTAAPNPNPKPATTVAVLPTIAPATPTPFGLDAKTMTMLRKNLWRLSGTRSLALVHHSFRR